jgi:hypothetical protein
MADDMLRRRQGRQAGHQRRRPPRALVDAALGVLAANLGVLAGWTQSTPLRVVVGGAFLLVTIAGVIVHQRLKPTVPTSLPAKGNIPFFKGRNKELSELERRHNQAQAKAGSPVASGPLLLAIHGRPGVGKTALAQQFALKIADDYPDGLLYQNMGTGGDPKPPRDILHSLLLELQWPEEEMRGRSAAELGGIFRAITADKRVLMVLDAARSLEQIKDVLPGGSKCTVITTSRANLLAGGGWHSQRIGPVTGEEATDIFLTALGPDRAVGPDLVSEAIELCDFQPNALLSFAARAADEGLVRALERLRPDQNRLDVLRYDGRDVAERLTSEYSNLEGLEREAFLLLTIPESESFVPWALQPLLGIGSAEAGNLLASISRVGLLEHEGRDPSGFGRYRFSSLARLFAEQQLRNDDLPMARVEAARRDFRHAYLAASMKVIDQLGVTGLPTLNFPVPDLWYPQENGWEERVASNLSTWIRAEFGSIIRVIQDAADSGQPTLCWQIAARLGDCYSPPAAHTEVRAAFRTALDAARAESLPTAEKKVRLAIAGYLTCTHEYKEAIAELNIVAEIARNEGDETTAAEAFRRLAHVWQETGHYRQASTALKDGRSASTHAGHGEERLLEMLLTENTAVREPEQWTRQPPINGLRPDQRDSSQFLEKILLGRAARRRRDSKASDELLEAARQFGDGNTAHSFDLAYEQAATRLHLAAYWRLRSNSLPMTDDRSCISLAALAVRSSDRLDRPHARAQARCVLAHALILAGEPEAAIKQLDAVGQFLQPVPSSDSERLIARSQRLRGEALLRIRDPQAALNVLEPARQWLERREPWAYAEIMMLIGSAHRQLREFSPALAAHAMATEIFRRHRDEVAADHALSELCATLREAGGGPLRTRWVRRTMARDLVAS